MILSKPYAFLKKDFQTEVSYRFAFFLQFGGIFFSVVMFYFVAELIGDAPNVQNSLSQYGGSYFSFVLIGIAFSNFLSVGLGSFSTVIRSEQMIGTLEAMLVTPTRLPTVVLSSSQWSFAFTSLRVGQQTSRQGHALLHTSGVFLEAPVSGGIHTDDVKYLVDTVPGFFAGQSVKGGEELEVAAAGQTPVETALFAGNEGDRTLDLVLLLDDVVAVDGGAAARRQHQRAQHLGQRGLPGTIGPE